MAIFSEKESQSVYFLEQLGLTRLDAVSYLSHGKSESSESEYTEEGESNEPDSIKWGFLCFRFLQSSNSRGISIAILVVFILIYE